MGIDKRRIAQPIVAEVPQCPGGVRGEGKPGGRLLRARKDGPAGSLTSTAAERKFLEVHMDPPVRSVQIILPADSSQLSQICACGRCFRLQRRETVWRFYDVQPNYIVKIIKIFDREKRGADKSD